MTAPAENVPQSLHSQIEAAPLIANAPNDWELRWTCCYQGEVDYERRGIRLRFRWAKCPWRWSWEKAGQRYWNFATREAFEAEHNGNHGMLTAGSEPVDAETLELFRQRVHSGAVTGFFCHLRQRWVQCKPTARRPGERTWQIRRKREAGGAKGAAHMAVPDGSRERCA